MELNKLVAAIEAMLFACGESLSRERICEVLDIDKNTLQKVIGKIKERYDSPDSGMELLELGGNYQLSTRLEYASYIVKALEIKRDVPLSSAALEVLSIVAYNEPVSRGFIEQVRGVDSTSVIASLCKKMLIEECGRMDLPGRPISYRTTDNFLRCFGISSLSMLPELPKEAELSEDVDEKMLAQYEAE